MIRQNPARREALRSGVAEIEKARRYKPRPDFERKQRARIAKPSPLIAYDIETSRIAAGTPRPLYLTAYAEGRIHLESPIRDLLSFRQLLIQNFLTEDLQGARFVAWNGNRFDAYFVAAALLGDPTYRLRPYLTRSKALRGLRVSLAEDGNKRTGRSWEFLDGIAMLGLAGVKLAKLLDTFAPDHPKMIDAIDFEREEFDSGNPKHRAYAMQDSIGLYHAMKRAERIMLDTFGEPLGVTMGSVAIKIFAAHIPQGVTVEQPIPDAEEAIFNYALRGGFCYCAKRYHGPVWKYDLNQAYAAAMREAPMPCGPILHGKGMPPMNREFMARITATNPANRIPFYYRTHNGARVVSVFGDSRIAETWITSIEYRQLLAEGWRIDCREHFSWAGSFTMRDYVDRLERLRTTCDGGPSGPIGTMVKATGNHSYGKTIARVEPIEYVIAGECPPDFAPFYGDEGSPIDHVFFRFDNDRQAKAYQKPQLGAWITSHVRMVLRRAALLDPDAWLYADTDCVVFSRDVSALLDIDGKRYGAWKIEEAGTVFRIIAKKVYHEVGGKKRSAKGLNVGRLSDADFAAWYEGDEPVQSQIQINNFLAVMQGAEMYRRQVRRGTAIEAKAAA